MVFSHEHEIKLKASRLKHAPQNEKLGFLLQNGKIELNENDLNEYSSVYTLLW